MDTGYRRAPSGARHTINALSTYGAGVARDETILDSPRSPSGPGAEEAPVAGAAQLFAVRVGGSNTGLLVFQTAGAASRDGGYRNVSVALGQALQCRGSPPPTPQGSRRHKENRRPLPLKGVTIAATAKGETPLPNSLTGWMPARPSSTPQASHTARPAHFGAVTVGSE